MSFVISKLSKNTQDFISVLSFSNTSRTPKISMAVARVLSSRLSLPSAPVADINAYYRVTNLAEIEAMVNQINECVSIDVNSVLDFVMKLYLLRYSMAHPAPQVHSFFPETAVEDFFGITRAMDKASLAVIKEDPSNIAIAANNFNRLVEELKV